MWICSCPQSADIPAQCKPKVRFWPLVTILDTSLSWRNLESLEQVWYKKRGLYCSPVPDKVSWNLLTDANSERCCAPTLGFPWQTQAHVHDWLKVSFNTRSPSSHSHHVLWGPVQKLRNTQLGSHTKAFSEAWKRLDLSVSRVKSGLFIKNTCMSCWVCISIFVKLRFFSISVRRACTFPLPLNSHTLKTYRKTYAHFLLCIFTRENRYI